MLTVYLIDRGGDKKKAIRSISKLEPSIIEKPKGTACTGLGNNCKHDWYMILFTDEYLEDILCDALPYFMASDYDYFNMYRCMDDGKNQRYFMNPRLFRKGVVLNKNGEPGSEYVGTSILDGFIFNECSG